MSPVTRPGRDDLEALTAPLVGRATRLDQVVRRLVDTAHNPGAALVCPWCREDPGWCTRTGGTNPCEGDEEYAAALDDTYSARELATPIGGT